MGAHNSGPMAFPHIVGLIWAKSRPNWLIHLTCSSSCSGLSRLPAGKATAQSPGRTKDIKNRYEAWMRTVRKCHVSQHSRDPSPIELDICHVWEQRKSTWHAGRRWRYMACDCSTCEPDRSSFWISGFPSYFLTALRRRN